MVKKHLSRMNAPKTWPIKKKGIKFITNPNPGSHNLKSSMPIGVVLTDTLKQAKTKKEAKKMLNSRNIIINKKPRTDLRSPIGLMDTLEIPAIKEQYRLLINKKGKLTFHPIKEEETKIKPFKIKNKKVIDNKTVQLNLNDGTNIIVKKDNYKTGDTIIVDLTKKEIKDHIKFEKGALVYITNGKRVSSTGTIETVKTFKGKQPDILAFKTKKGEIVETKKEYALVIGKNKPLISIPEK